MQKPIFTNAFRHFTGIDKHNLGFTKDFAGINICIRDLYKYFSDVKFRSCIEEHFSSTLFCGIENDQKLIIAYSNKQMTKMIFRRPNSKDIVSDKNCNFHGWSILEKYRGHDTLGVKKGIQFHILGQKT